MIIWNQKLGKPECPYMRRWVFDFKLFSIRLHRWYFGDDPRHLHDHPWWFWTFILWGSYTDVIKEHKRKLNTWTLHYRPALHTHTVETKGCWTLLLCGPEKRIWGFWIKHKSGNPYWVKATRYFRKKGHHPCQTN